MRLRHKLGYFQAGARHFFAVATYFAWKLGSGVQTRQEGLICDNLRCRADAGIGCVAGETEARMTVDHCCKALLITSTSSSLRESMLNGLDDASDHSCVPSACRRCWDIGRTRGMH
jgi:hypothetical protein